MMAGFSSSRYRGMPIQPDFLDSLSTKDPASRWCYWLYSRRLSLKRQEIDLHVWGIDEQRHLENVTTKHRSSIISSRMNPTHGIARVDQPVIVNMLQAVEWL